jgi:ATP-dependent Zn protease
MILGILLIGLSLSNGFIRSSIWNRNAHIRSLSQLHDSPKYPFSKRYYENAIKRLNSKNITIQHNAILSYPRYSNERKRFLYEEEDTDDDEDGDYKNEYSGEEPEDIQEKPKLRIIISGGGGPIDPSIFGAFGKGSDDEGDTFEKFKRRTNKKSENFEVVSNSSISFKDIGGYQNVKAELAQCVDLLKNYTKYQGYNVRIPKGLILEGPPGNGKTLIAKALAGEAGVGFISVSGAQFQEKYVGVGSSRIRELFNLAKTHIPCIIFIDEIDAVGRARSGDGEQSTSERDSTLNELLVAMDGFKTTPGIFLVGATNRADLLDPALTRPGRIDKRIFIGNPDETTRKSVIGIHIDGKPHDNTVVCDDLAELTTGLSCAQIENLLNEAMLNALRNDRNVMNDQDIDHIMNKMMVGWQPSEHQFTPDIIDHIAIHYFM